MDKTILIEKIEKEFEELKTILNKLGTNKINLKAANNGDEDLTVKDVLAHITAWKANLIDRGYKKLNRDHKPMFNFSASNLKEKNHKIYEFYKLKSIDEILKIMDDIHSEMMKMIKLSDEKDLIDEKGKVKGWVYEEALRHPSVHRRRQIEPLLNK